jgi:hypothetical protein
MVEIRCSRNICVGFRALSELLYSRLDKQLDLLYIEYIFLNLIMQGFFQADRNRSVNGRQLS